MLCLHNAASFLLAVPFQPALIFLLFFLFLCGALVTGRMLLVISRLVCQKDETGRLNGDPELKGERVSLATLTWRYDSTGFVKFLDALPAKSIALAKQWFMLDFWFMPFLYSAMFLLCLWLNLHWRDEENTGYRSFLPIAQWASLSIWVADVLENIYALRAVKRYSYLRVTDNPYAQEMAEAALGKSVFAMRSFSVSKWILAFGYIVLVLMTVVRFCHPYFLS